MSPVNPATLPPLVILLTESTLVEICDRLQAHRFELDGERVTFVSSPACGPERRWTGMLGEHLLDSGPSWRIFTELPAETSLVSVA